MTIKVTNDGQTITVSATVPARDAKALARLICAIRAANAPYAGAVGGVELIGSGA